MEYRNLGRAGVKVSAIGLALQRRFALLRRFKALETCKNALICPFFGVSKRRSNIQHVVVI